MTSAETIVRARPYFTQRSRGITLIELLIVVAIVAILGAIAYPSYQEQVRRGLRAECKSAVMNTLQAQERYFSANNTYATSLSLIGVNSFSGDGPTTSACTMSARACTGVPLTQCVEIVATTAKGDTPCTTITRDSRGIRGGSDVALCWR